MLIKIRSYHKVLIVVPLQSYPCFCGISSFHRPTPCYHSPQKWLSQWAEHPYILFPPLCIFSNQWRFGDQKKKKRLHLDFGRAHHVTRHRMDPDWVGQWAQGIEVPGPYNWRCSEVSIHTNEWWGMKWLDWVDRLVYIGYGHGPVQDDRRLFEPACLVIRPKFRPLSSLPAWAMPRPSPLANYRNPLCAQTYRAESVSIHGPISWPFSC